MLPMMTILTISEFADRGFLQCLMFICHFDVDVVDF